MTTTKTKNNETVILVTGATGTVGSEVVKLTPIIAFFR